MRVRVRVAALLPYEHLQVEALLELSLALTLSLTFTPASALTFTPTSARTCRSKPSLNYP